MLFSLLIALAIERLFNYHHHPFLQKIMHSCFKKLNEPSLTKTFILMISVGLGLGLLFYVIKPLLFGLFTLLLSIVICWLCIGAGSIRKHYRAYLDKASHAHPHAIEQMSEEFSLIHGLPDEEDAQLTELQNALLWINFRYYLSPLFWFIFLGPIALGVYAVLRNYQTWLAQQHDPYSRKVSGIDKILIFVEWLPCRLAGIAYVILGNSDKTFPIWLASLSDFSTPQYLVITTLTQLSLQDKRNNDPVLMPIIAVKLAKKATIFFIIILSFLTIYGAVN